MTLIPLAAALIRQVVLDENYRLDLEAAVTQDDAVARGLIEEPVTPDDLPWLSPNQWQWFAYWRQSEGGR